MARKKPGQDRKSAIMQMRGSDEFRAWMERLATHDRLTVSELAERAMVFYAKQIGFAEKPPRR